MRSWLPSNLDERVVRVICAALDDVGEHEEPAGSNRGPYVDGVVAAVGSPLGSYWCAAALAKWYRAGPIAMPPAQLGSCETWRRWALTTARLASKPELGGAVLYGTATHASHCGLIVCLSPLLSVEGNTSLDGYSRDGEAVQCKLVNREHVIGYIHRSAIE